MFPNRLFSPYTILATYFIEKNCLVFWNLQKWNKRVCFNLTKTFLEWKKWIVPIFILISLNKISQIWLFFQDVELASWPIEEVSWYLGSEAKRQPPHSLNVTFIHPRNEPVIRSKEKPHFGRTISFESRDFYIKWITAMLVAEFGKDLKPPTEKLVVLEWNDVFDLFWFCITLPLPNKIGC